jgi:hypothetical protein
MNRFAWIFVAAAGCLTGCTPTYRVHVNTYSELEGPLSPPASVYVATDPNSRNPILGRQIAARIRALLAGHGYTPVETIDAAAYLLTFEAGVDSERVMDYATYGGPYGGFGFGRSYGSRFGLGLGYTTYRPYVTTVYTHWLRLRLSEAKPPGPRAQDRRTVWLGEGAVGTDDPDLREAVNYLLVGTMEYFGIDTNQWTTVKIRRNDPRILGSATE